MLKVAMTLMAYCCRLLLLVVLFQTILLVEVGCFHHPARYTEGPADDVEAPVWRVKRIVTQPASRSGLEKSGRSVGATVERADNLRQHLMAVFVLLRRRGGFLGGEPRSWAPHEINLASQLVATFYLLKESGLRLPSGKNDSEHLVDFMGACFVLLNEETTVIQLPARSQTDTFTVEDADSFLRELMSVFFILFSHEKSLALPSPLELEDDAIRQLRHNYTELLSRAGGIKLPFRECGENLNPSSPRSEWDRSDDWPWMVVLLANQFNWRLFCGAVLINEWFVMTAAHCLSDKLPGDVTVRLGEYNFREPSTSRTDHRAEMIIIHERFNNVTFDNDIALIKLKERANIYGSTVWPICLPPTRLDIEGKEAYVAGWGKTAVDGDPSEVLLDTNIPVWEQDECENLFHIRKDPINYQFQFCAGPKEGGEDACDGDSGGPMMYKMESGRWAVVGIVSWGIDGRCAVKGEPGIYTRVGAYTNWIYSKMLPDVR